MQGHKPAAVGLIQTSEIELHSFNERTFTYARCPTSNPTWSFPAGFVAAAAVALKTAAAMA